MAADPKLEALLELERRGALPPDLAQRLQAYRSQGVSKTTALSPNGQPRQTDEERLELKTSRDKARSALALIGRVQPHLDRVKTLLDANLKGADHVQPLNQKSVGEGKGVVGLVDIGGSRQIKKKNR